MAVNPQEIVGAESSPAPINIFNKYHFPEFAGYSGERRFRTFCYAILPAALARTAMSAISFQAPGRTIFVGEQGIADENKPGKRKIEIDIQRLTERGLMIPGTGVEVVGGKARRVITKDFYPLYSFAHEYYLWTQSNEYIPCENAYRDEILANPQMAERLARFDNYRRMLYNKKPGRKRGNESITGNERGNTNNCLNNNSPYRINRNRLYDSIEDDSNLHPQNKLGGVGEDDRSESGYANKQESDSYSPPDTGYTNQPGKPEQIELFESSEPEQEKEPAAKQSARPENITQFVGAGLVSAHQGQQAKEPAGSRSAQEAQGEPQARTPKEPRQLHTLKKPTRLDRDSLFSYIEKIDAVKMARRLPHLPHDIVSDIPDICFKLKDQQPSSTYGFLLNIWTRFNLAGGSVEEFKAYLEEIATYCYGAPKTSRTPVRSGSAQKPQPQGIQLFVTLTKNNLGLYLSGQEWRPEMVKAMQRQQQTTSYVHIVHTQNVVEGHLTTTDNTRFETRDSSSTVYTNSKTTSPIPAEEDESTMSITERNKQNDTQTNEQARAIQIIQANKTVAGETTESIEQENNNTVEAIHIEQANEIKPTAELYRHQETMKAVESLRDFIEDPLYPQTCEHACITCGSPIRTRGSRCVVCSPLPSWDSRTRERIRKIMAKVPTLQQAQEIVSRG